jgi:hypothetical protein
MIATGTCCACGALFDFNPERVPCARGKYVDGKFVLDPNGRKEPVCKTCMEKGNEIRVKAGKPPFIILPGAYEAEECA